MSEQQTEDDYVDIDDFDIVVQATLYPEGGDEIASRPILLGVHPLVLLEMSQSEEGALVLEYTGSLIDSHEVLLETLETFTSKLREAIRQNANTADGEVVVEESSALEAPGE